MKPGTKKTSSLPLPGNGKPVNITQEVFVKMSKKIAQLTKVIYYLHSKQDDHDFHIDSLTNAYEDEIDAVIADAKNQLESQNQNRKTLETELSELKWKLEQKEVELKEKLVEFNEKDRLNQETLKSLSLSVTDLSSALKEKNQELEMIQSKHEQRVKLMEQEIARFHQERDDYIGKLNETHHDQIEQLKKSLEKDQQVAKLEYANIIQETQTKLQDIQNTHNTQSAIYEQNIANYKEEIQQMESRMLQIQNEHQISLSELEKTYNQGLSKEGEQVNRLNRKNEELKQDQLKKQAEIQQLKDELEVQREKYENLANDLQKVTQVMHQNAIEMNQVKSRQLNETQRADELQQELVRLIETNRDTIDKLNSELRDKSTEIESFKSKMQHLYDRLRDEDAKSLNLQSRIDSLKQWHSEKEQEIIDLNAKLEKASNELIVNKKEMSELTEINSSMTRVHEAELNEILQKLSVAQENSKQRMQDAKSLAEKEISTLQKQHSLEVEKLKQEIRELQTMNKQYEFELGESHVKLIATGDDKRKLKSVSDKQRSTNKRLEDEIALLKQQLQITEAQVRMNVEKEFMLRIEKLEKKWQEKYESGIKTAEEQLNQTVSMNSSLEQLAQKHKETQLKLQKDYEQERKRIEALLQEKTDKVDFLNSELDQVKAELRNTKDYSTKNSVYEKRDLETQISNLKTQYNQQLKALEAQNDLTLEKMRVENAENVRQLKETFDSAFEQQKLENQTSLADKLKSQQDEFTEKIGKIQLENGAKLQKMEQDNIELLTMQMKQLQQDHLNKINQREEQVSQEINAKEQQIKHLKNEIGNFLMAQHDFKEKVEYLEADIRTLQMVAAERDKEMMDLKQDTALQIEQADIQMQKKSEATIAKVHKQHLEEMRLILLDFEKAQQFLKDQIEEQKKQLVAAEERYANRDPRDVDIFRIKELETDVATCNSTIDSLKREIEWMRLEMKNKETTFNKIFNNSPLVGVLEPFKKKSDPALNAKLPPLRGKPKDRANQL